MTFGVQVVVVVTPEFRIQVHIANSRRVSNATTCTRESITLEPNCSYSEMLEFRVRIVVHEIRGVSNTSTKKTIVAAELIYFQIEMVSHRKVSDNWKQVVSRSPND